MIQETEKKTQFFLLSEPVPEDEPTFDKWLIRLKSSGAHWCNFTIYSVTYTLEGVQHFLPKRWKSSPDDAVPWTTDAEFTVDGFIKWDGCTEFNATDHFCNGPESYAELHTVIQLMLKAAHSLMLSLKTERNAGLDWEPIEVETNLVVTPWSPS